MNFLNVGDHKQTPFNSISLCHFKIMIIGYFWKAEEHKNCFALNFSANLYAVFWLSDFNIYF